MWRNSEMQLGQYRPRLVAVWTRVRTVRDRSNLLSSENKVDSSERYARVRYVKRSQCEHSLCYVILDRPRSRLPLFRILTFVSCDTSLTIQILTWAPPFLEEPVAVDNLMYSRIYLKALLIQRDLCYLLITHAVQHQI